MNFHSCSEKNTNLNNERSESYKMECESNFQLSQSSTKHKTKKLMKDDRPKKTKVHRKEMIEEALIKLNGRGTKKEVFRMISNSNDLALEKNSVAYKSLEQALSKYFTKQPLAYSLVMGEEFNKMKMEKTTTMKQMIVGVLLEMPLNSGDIKQIKNAILSKYGN